MSGISYTFDLASPQHSAPSAPTASGYYAALEQSYLSASAPREVASPAPVGEEPGPVLTTLAVGEEDGGIGASPEAGGMSSPVPGGDYQVTTLAIGEEDGGGGASSQAMAPIADDHSIIGGHSTSTMGMGELPDGYGQMQPIYSPGEPEYPAFVKTSQTTDILNFHPVPRSFTATVQQTMPAAQPAAPISMDSYTTADPATMAPIADTAAPATTSAPSTFATSTPAPVANGQTTYATFEAPTAQTNYAAEPMVVEADSTPLNGNYVSVGSYEAYVTNGSSAATIAPVDAATHEPLPFEVVQSEPVYEQHQPVADVTAYDSATAPAAKPAPSETVYEQYQPASEAPAPTTIAPVETPVSTEIAAPEMSAEPIAKPALFEKDAPLNFSSTEQAADPADGKPDHAAPAESEKPVATAPKPDATYVTVPLDAYVVDAPAKADATQPAPKSDTGPQEAAPTAPEAPAEIQTPPAAPSSGISMGGSFTVTDQPLPDSISGESSGMKTAAPEMEAPKGEVMPKEELSITTLAIGEEDGGGS